MKLQTFGVTLALLSSTAISTAAFAADEEMTTSEIIVTAQKRAQRLLDVPLSVTAMSGSELQDRQVARVADLVRIEPSLQVATNDLGTPVFTIRGVGYSEKSVHAPPAISVYQNEVPFAYPVLSRAAVLDLERVEVLKGPQGTAFGQNATGGAINFVAARPTEEYRGAIRTTVDNFGGFDLEGFVSGALSDTVKSRLAFQTQQGGAWQRSASRDDELGDRDFWAARLITEWEASDSVKVSLNLNAWQDRSESQAMQNAGFYLFFPEGPTAGASSSKIPDPVLLANGGYAPDIAAVISSPRAKENNRSADWTAGTHPRNDAEYYQAALRVEAEVAKGVMLTSITNYADYRQANETDPSGVNVQSTHNIVNADVTSFFQEVRLSGDFGKGSSSWMLGVNYSRDNSQEFIDRDLRTTGTYFTFPTFSSVLEFANSKVNTYSAFANFSYPLTSTIGIDGGIRYTQSNSDLSGCAGSDDKSLIDLIVLITGGNANLPAGSCYTRLPDNTNGGLYVSQLHQDNISWRAALNWKPSEDILFYTSASKGFKAGSMPQAGAISWQSLVPVTQESILAYEVGVKGKAADGRIEFSGAVFHYDYTDKQFFGREPTILGDLFKLVNVPKSRVNGAEATVLVRPAKGLTADVAVSYLDTKVTSSFNNFDGYGQPFNLQGDEFPYTPEWSLQGGVRYEFPVGGNNTAYVGARGSYQSSTTSHFGGRRATPHPTLPKLENKAYAMLDLAAGVQFGDRWSVDLWARNVTNTYYWGNIFYLIDTVQRQTGRPATYGASIKFNY